MKNKINERSDNETGFVLKCEIVRSSNSRVKLLSLLAIANDALPMRKHSMIQSFIHDFPSIDSRRGNRFCYSILARFKLNGKKSVFFFLLSLSSENKVKVCRITSMATE